MALMLCYANKVLKKSNLKAEKKSL
jgi:hypothetical protein